MTMMMIIIIIITIIMTKIIEKIIIMTMTSADTIDKKLEFWLVTAPLSSLSSVCSNDRYRNLVISKC